jgi:hypothetical protein
MATHDAAAAVMAPPPPAAMAVPPTGVMSFIDRCSVRSLACLGHSIGFDAGCLQRRRDRRGLRRAYRQTAERGNARRAEQAAQKLTSVHGKLLLSRNASLQSEAQRIAALLR